jgi:hypothetical protein
MPKKLEKEFKYYLDNQENLVRNYNGKFIVIKNRKVIGAYDSELEAVERTAEKHKLGTFLVQKCEHGSESYSQIYHSRVAFV